MKKKLLSMVSVLLITAMLLTGCANFGTGSETSTEGTTSTQITNSASENSTSAATIMTSSQVVVDTEFTARDLEVGYDDSTATAITLDGSSIEITGNGATADGSTLTIREEGTYIISGSLTDGQIIVDTTADDAKVQLVLNGVTINCSDNAPIYVKNADKVFITLAENSKNSLTDGSEYVQADDNTVDGVIFSKADLTLNGNGTLNITGNYKHGIASKDDLVITSGTYLITAVKDALNGKDSVKIKDGTLTLSAAQGNGIQSKNGDDTTKGYVYIEGGTITVTKSQEGIEGTAIVIAGGTIDITALDDGMNAAAGSSTATDANTSAPASDQQTSATELSAVSADNSVSTVNAASNGNAVSTMNAASSDNTVPATSAITVTASTESSTDATSSATTQDETTMKNGGPGRDGGMGGGMNGDIGGGNMGGGEMENNTNCYIMVTGGKITINAEGDGIDSNGSIDISGGSIYVSGPTSNGDGALDYNGSATITGGTVVFAGSVGMAQGFSDTSTQYSILYNFSSSITAGTEVSIKDSKGNVIISYTPVKQYQSVVISSPDLEKDATYTITSGDQTADITLSSVVTSAGETSTGFPGGMGNNPGGGMGGRPNGAPNGAPDRAANGEAPNGDKPAGDQTNNGEAIQN